MWMWVGVNVGVSACVGSISFGSLKRSSVVTSVDDDADDCQFVQRSKRPLENNDCGAASVPNYKQSTERERRRKKEKERWQKSRVTRLYHVGYSHSHPSFK